MVNCFTGFLFGIIVYYMTGYGTVRACSRSAPHHHIHTHTAILWCHLYYYMTGYPTPQPPLPHTHHGLLSLLLSLPPLTNPPSSSPLIQQEDPANMGPVALHIIKYLALIMLISNVGCLQSIMFSLLSPNTDIAFVLNCGYVTISLLTRCVMVLIIALIISVM